jgi:hypothetical protein
VIVGLAALAAVGQLSKKAEERRKASEATARRERRRAQPIPKAFAWAFSEEQKRDHEQWLYEQSLAAMPNVKELTDRAREYDRLGLTHSAEAMRSLRDITPSTSPLDRIRRLR